MKLRIVIMLAIVMLLSGCSKVENETLTLDYFEVNKAMITDLHVNDIDKIIQETKIRTDMSVFLFKMQDGEKISGGININNKLYSIGEVSMQNTPSDLMGIEKIQVFGKEAIKFYGVLGAASGQAVYCFIEDIPQGPIIRIDGNTVETDLDNDDKKEIVSTHGTVPETIIYRLKQDKVLAANVNKSIDAKAVYLKDIDKGLFEVYFQQNDPEQYKYYKDNLRKVETY